MKIAGMDFVGPSGLHDLRDEPGVYIVLDKFDDRYGRTMLYCIDVGESDRVYSRVGSHDRRACWDTDSQGALAFAVHYTSGGGDARRRTEQEVRAYLSPPCGGR